MACGVLSADTTMTASSADTARANVNTSTNLRSDDTSPHSMERNKPERELGGDQRALLVVEDNEALRMEIAELALRLVALHRVG